METKIIETADDLFSKLEDLYGEKQSSHNGGNRVQNNDTAPPVETPKQLTPPVVEQEVEQSAPIISNDDSGQVVEPTEQELVAAEQPMPLAKNALAEAVSLVVEPRRRNVLDKYSLTGSSSMLEMELTESSYVLGDIVLTGQASIIFAAPNTGKTLLTINLAMEAASKKYIDPTLLYYVNVDDTARGLVEKLKIAEEYGFQMLAEGHNKFKATEFKELILAMIEKKQCKGVVIIADTVKKLSNLIDKKKSSDFNSLIRTFVLLWYENVNSFV